MVIKPATPPIVWCHLMKIHNKFWKSPCYYRIYKQWNYTYGLSYVNGLEWCSVWHILEHLQNTRTHCTQVSPATSPMSHSNISWGWHTAHRNNELEDMTQVTGVSVALTLSRRPWEVGCLPWPCTGTRHCRPAGWRWLWRDTCLWLEPLALTTTHWGLSSSSNN